MFIDIDQSIVRQRNEELMHDAREWYLRRSLRANREQRLGSPPQGDSRTTAAGVIKLRQRGAAHMTLIQNRATIGKVMILGFLLATLMTIVLSAAPPAGAAVPSGKAYGWGYNNDGQLGNAPLGSAPTWNSLGR
jgi:hypothetical protein